MIDDRAMKFCHHAAFRLTLPSRRSGRPDFTAVCRGSGTTQTLSYINHNWRRSGLVQIHLQLQQRCTQAMRIYNSGAGRSVATPMAVAPGNCPLSVSILASPSWDDDSTTADRSPIPLNSTVNQYSDSSDEPSRTTSRWGICGRHWSELGDFGGAAQCLVWGPGNSPRVRHNTWTRPNPAGGGFNIGPTRATLANSESG